MFKSVDLSKLGKQSCLHLERAFMFKSVDLSKLGKQSRLHLERHLLPRKEYTYIT